MMATSDSTIDLLTPGRMTDPIKSTGKSSPTISVKQVGSWGCVSAVDSRGRTTFAADAHRGGKRFVVRADEKLTVFIELESGIWVQRIVSTSWPDFFQTPDHAPGSSAAACC
jgi:hypothetical protein